MAKPKGTKITKDLIIAALAYDCMWRVDEGIFSYCSKVGRSNCNPRLCTQCTNIFKTMAKIGSGEIQIDI